MIVEAIRTGNYAEVSARAAGIHETTYYRWMETGEADEEQGRDTAYRQFREAVLTASAEAETTAVVTLREAMPTDPRLAILYLERRFPDRWHRRERHDVNVGGGISHEVKLLDGREPVEIEGSSRRAAARALLAGDVIEGNGHLVES